MKTALYLRVSKSDESQDPDNQLKPLLKMADSLDLKVVDKYIDTASGGSSDRPQFQQMLEDARIHKFDMILVWSLDRFSREGITNTLAYLKKLKNANVGLKSLQDSWLDTRDEGIGQLLIVIMSWVAEQERLRISERTKAGLVVARANGKILGRPNGSKDKGKRKKVGYLLRWANN